MSVELLHRMVGEWHGTCRTWFQPEELADESAIKGSVVATYGNNFVRHKYESSLRGKPRSGEELIAFNSVTQRFQVSWIDEFHMNYAILFSEGEASDAGFTVAGKYDVGPQEPVWGWETVVQIPDDNHLSIVAYNVSPDGDKAKAVETIYTRVSADVAR